jgi:trimethylamine--corrinoid protein Co-methyltransferase
LPWRQLQYIDGPIEPLDDDGLERIHDAAMRIVEEIGIDFLHDEARGILKRAGCDVRTGSVTVRMDRAFVMEQVAKAPPSISLQPRNPERTVIFGGPYAAFGQVASPPPMFQTWTVVAGSAIARIIRIFSNWPRSSIAFTSPADIRWNP